MKRVHYNFNKSYTFDPNHNRAHYTFDGETYMNNGDFCEVMLKSVLGYNAEKDGNTAYDKGSDIEELCMSVKSSKATLVNRVIGTDFDSVKETYFATVHSTSWAYVTHDAESLDAYYMDRVEFAEFLDNFGYFAKERTTIRIREETKAMIRWLDAKVEE